MDYSKADCQAWFDRIKREVGIAPTAMAEQIGITPSTINMPLRDGNDKVVSLKTLKAVADHLSQLSRQNPESAPTILPVLEDTQRLFGFTVRQDDMHAMAYSEKSTPAIASAEHSLAQRKDKSEIEAAGIERQSMNDFLLDPRSIPVLGTAAGSALGSFEIASEVIDHVRRPPSLAGIKDIYAIYVVGESMVPEHNPGDLRIIHPHRPARPGDSVVIQTYNSATDTREAFIKRLISMNSKEVKCYQHNPKLEVTYTIPNGDPALNNGDTTYAFKIHKVLSVNELHGF